MSLLNQNIYRKALQIYKEALLNEILIDEVAFTETKLDTLTNYKTIRTYHTQSYVRKYPNFIRVVCEFIVFFWKIINISIQTKSFVEAFFTRMMCRKKNGILIDRVVLIATHRLLPQLEKIKNKSEIPDIHLFINEEKKLNHPINSIYLSQITNYKLIFKAYFLSLFFPFYFSHPYHRIHNLQTYTSYKWFLCYLTMQEYRIGEIWFGNHYDRWAVLFDNLDIRKKNLVQHGIENGLEVMTKLKTVNKVFFIDNTQIPYFTHKIIVSEFEVDFLEIGLCLKKILPEDKFKVLIIGNVSLCQSEEDYIISRLGKISSIALAVKPHPILSMKLYDNLLQNNQFTLLKEKNDFPDVDIVVSYPSTLAIEYSQLEKTILYYSDYKLEEIPNIIIELSQKQSNL